MPKIPAKSRAEQERDRLRRLHDEKRARASRARTPAWAKAVIVLLVLGLAGSAFVFIRGQGHADEIEALIRQRDNALRMHEITMDTYKLSRDPGDKSRAERHLRESRELDSRIEALKVK